MSETPLLGVRPSVGAACDRALRVSVDLRELEGHPLDALRLLLVGDVLHRLAEDMRGCRGSFVVFPSGTDLVSRLARPAKALAIRAPWSCPDAASEDVSGDLVDIALEPVRRERAAAGPVPARRTLRVAGVAGRVRGSSITLTPDALLRDRDPLAIRLALLRVPYGIPAALSLARLHRAEETLLRWRIKMAGWHDMPVEAAPSDVIDATSYWLAADLDTGAVLTLLHRLEIDHGVGSGGKFAAFTQADRCLALQLGRLVGKLPR